MSEATKNRAEAVIENLNNIRMKVDELKGYVQRNVNDPELITKLTSLSDQTLATATHIRSKLHGKLGG
jgi:hypothetical protein